jgi:hypothetical protein
MKLEIFRHGITTTSTRSWKSSAQGWHHNNINTKLEIFSTRLASTLLPLSREVLSRLHQACLESVQTLHETEAWSTHQQHVHPCQHTGDLWLLSAPYHRCNDIRSLCVLTCHGTHGSLSSLCNSGYHIESQLLPSSDHIDCQQLPKPYGFTTSGTCNNVFCFFRAESNT